MLALTKVDISFSLSVPTVLVRIAVLVTLLYRRLRYGYTFRRIKLTRGKYAIVDPEDFEELNQYKWHCNSRGYAKRAIPNESGKGPKQVQVAMHNQICPVPEGMFADHINRDRLDNRKANLRPATLKQNLWNRKLAPKNVKTRYRGVNWDKSRQKWRVSLKVDGSRRKFGSFTDETEAAKRYDEIAKKYRGEFAVLNFPDD